MVETATSPDDLQVIKGIGPKIASLLQESGVTTFNQLAKMNAGQLRDILAKGGSRLQFIDPSPWPAEARRLVKARKS
jgi:predicted flap endonuclease-1-like 5' DNA nuclease